MFNLQPPRHTLLLYLVSRASPVHTRGAQLYEENDHGRPFEVEQSGVDLKPPQAAVVKSDGGERCGNAGT